MSWSWRTKPRSIIKTIQWFPYFSKLKGQNWEEKSSKVSKNMKPIHPVRRAYIYEAHSEEDAWLSSISYNEYLKGTRDIKETESNGRNDKTTFEFYGFGYVDKEGKICTTEVGSKIVQGSFDNEDYLKQLLKLRVPNWTYTNSNIKNSSGVFPFQIILEALRKYESLNRSELALLFGCTEIGQIPTAIMAIGEFKKRYEELSNKNDTKTIKNLYKEIFEKYYGAMPNQSASYYSYAEALSRTLVYTGLFSISGRSIATKVRIAEHSRIKVKLLQEKYQFTYPENITSLEQYMDWFGAADNIILPWENSEERIDLILDKANILIGKLEQVNIDYHQEANLTVNDINEILLQAKSTSSVSALKELEKTLSTAIISHNEEYFIKFSSKQKKERDNILEKFNDILDNEDMSALWLEVNTWKSLIGIQGTHRVKRNFNIEDDLTPRSFAPGVGNTPDMELYNGNYIIIPEVSLMTGVRQWEHEASSVVDHVLSFINEYADKQVLGLFISSSINIRTFWQFYILCRESWVGRPVPVVPLTIVQYVDVIKFIYDKNLSIEYLKNLLEDISSYTSNCKNYVEWKDSINNIILNWKNSTL